MEGRGQVRMYEGRLIGQSGRFAIVVSRFNELIGKQLLAGALDALRRHGVEDERIAVAWVPGSFEIPLVAKRLAGRGFDAVICLGAVIRGATSHYDYVAGGVAAGIAAVSLEAGIPVIFGVLTTDTIEQAIERAGTKAGNKGFDAAVTAIETVTVLAAIDAG